MTHDASPLVLVDRPFAGCAVVALNRPRAMNALSLALRRALVSTFEALRSDADARVVVLTGAGKAFCAGLDLKELGAATDPGAAVVPTADEDPVLAMSHLAAPVIGAINGPAITGGFELALACDLLIASTNASFADTHARVGVLPGWGLSQRLPRLVGPGRAKELSLTGNFIGAEQAEAWGLVNRAVEPEALLPTALKLASDMLSVLPEMLSSYKSLIDAGLRTNLAAGLELERERSRAWAVNLRGTDIEGRRHEIAERGRAQGTPPNSD
ncbi:enoyl-CoA hydratase [Variovorax humicola]|uniref:Enoyl-CoA hydratase n=1 Tax=Variovorax humicola TaxID=1769758 RepID=A0ABU8W746_9BURK